ncbi:hypothetical protein [Salinisphaera hydrothermalis]|uniref:Uncharacterized protein n=1 Tax=Salinisphaera hydrothermalis (strain C41B8) TaxID=1304275 RepID=A0A084IME7_SALHC|nr:hypothetical protein [Salinisphaera hydrothermalis]KEZ77881.1 hypothetical protein C41B8_07537 [Salinisphaera hydrothermalis C41B8]
MPDWFFINGHLGWPLFTVMAYSGFGMLVADYVWRRVTMPAKWLFTGLLGIWLLGLLLLAALW